MIEIQIVMTGKGYGRASKWQGLGDENHRFSDKTAAMTFLSDRYGRCKRAAIYRDGPKGESVQTGYIYGFRNADWSHAPVDKWLQQDWVEFRQCEILPIAA